MPLRCLNPVHHRNSWYGKRCRSIIQCFRRNLPATFRCRQRRMCKNLQRTWKSVLQKMRLLCTMSTGHQHSAELLVCKLLKKIWPGWLGKSSLQRNACNSKRLYRMRHLWNKMSLRLTNSRNVKKMCRWYGIKKKAGNLKIRFPAFYAPAKNRCDRIRTCVLCVPNAALYQTEPRIATKRLLCYIALSKKSSLHFNNSPRNNRKCDFQ